MQSTSDTRGVTDNDEVPHQVDIPDAANSSVMASVAEGALNDAAARWRPPPPEFVMIQHVISDGRPYGDHNDNNPTTTSTGPTFEQSITVTIYIEEGEDGLYTIIWKRDSSTP